MAYKNKEDQALCAKQHYERNKDLIKERAKKFKEKARKRNREYVNSYLSEHPCIDCGISDIRVLEFDHVRGEKKAAISNLVSSAVSISKIEEEIEKCEVRCANCHRIKTYETLWNK